MQALESGKKDNLIPLLDSSLIVFGPRKQHAADNRADALLPLGKKLALRSSSLEVVASQGGRSAWAFEVVSVDGEPHAVTAVLVNSDDLWQVEAASIAFTPARSSIKGELVKDTIAPPGASLKSKIAPDARGAVDRFQKGLLDQEMWGSDLASRSEAIVVGPAAGEVTKGKAEIKKLWKKRLDAKTRAVASGDVVANITPDGQLAWVSAPITRVAEGEDPTPLRAFAVFEKAGASDWKLIALHESVAIDVAGAGAPFKKILPPMPAKDPLPVETSKDDKKTAKKDAKAKDDKPKKMAKKKSKADDEDDKPKKVAKKKSKDVDDEDEKPKKKTKKSDEDEKPKKVAKKKSKDDDDEKPAKKKKTDDDEDEKPKKSKFSKKKAPTADEEEDAPKKKKKSKADDEDEKPKKSSKKKKSADDDEDEAPKKKKKSADDDEDEAPKKKKKASDDDE